MKNRSIVIVSIVVVLVILLSYLAANPIKIGDRVIGGAKDSMELGLDLAGGVYVVLEANTDATGDELKAMMEQTKAIISQRVDGLGVSEPNITIENDNRIRVELAGIKDPQEAIDLIGKTALLEFIDPIGNVVITGRNVINSKVIYQQGKLAVDEPVVSLELDNEGTELFRLATARLALETEPQKKAIFIVLDGKVISSPLVQDEITNGKPVISGGFDITSANNLSTLIKAGALPVEMQELQTSVIGPTLGLEAYDKSIIAGALAMLIIFAVMIIIYKVPGFVAALALTVYVLIVVAAMIFIGVKLTLPGIAGLVLSIGMAVDSNVLIFERIREEIIEGKSVRVAIDMGFKRALRAIIDSNVTTLIAGLVLYNFGIGPIKGFGVTLILGIVASIITAVFFTKFILKLVAEITGGKNTKLYGV